MKLDLKILLSSVLVGCMATSMIAQVETGGVVRRRTADKRKSEKTESRGVSGRMQSFFETTPIHDADLEFSRDIYRELDLKKVENAPLYYPEDVVDGRENLLRVVLGAVVDGSVPAYEYLDGREVFTDKYKLNVGEMLDRFGIYYKEGKGSTAKNKKYVIEEADVPTGLVLNYYIIEKWEFDRRTSRMQTRVEAICPVITRTGDFGGETKYPMFWVKYSQLRPFLAKQYIFADDDNNLEQYSIDDYFTLGMYKGDIYKTKNLRNLSMAQMYPDEDTRKQAQDSIDRRLRSYGKGLWIPSRAEHLAKLQKEAAAASALAKGDTIPGRTVVKNARVKEESSRSSRRARVAQKPKEAPASSSSSSSAVRSVRRTRR